MPFSQAFSSGPTRVNEYALGKLVRVSVEITAVTGGAFIDPSVLKLSIRPPGGVTTTYTYNTNPEIIKDSQGKYHADVNANVVGEWAYAWWSTGSGQSAEEKTFIVKPRKAT